MKISRSSLTEMKERFEDRKEVLSNVLNAVQELISEVTKEIKELDTMIEQDILDTIKAQKPKKLIDPKFCQHANKKKEQHGNAETVKCTDCNLLLSFKQL